MSGSGQELMTSEHQENSSAHCAPGERGPHDAPAPPAVAALPVKDFPGRRTTWVPSRTPVSPAAILAAGPAPFRAQPAPCCPPPSVGVHHRRSGNHRSERPPHLNIPDVRAGSLARRQRTRGVRRAGKRRGRGGTVVPAAGRTRAGPRNG